MNKTMHVLSQVLVRKNDHVSIYSYSSCCCRNYINWATRLISIIVRKPQSLSCLYLLDIAYRLNIHLFFLYSLQAAAKHHICGICCLFINHNIQFGYTRHCIHSSARRKVMVRVYKIDSIQIYCIPILNV